MSDVDGSSEYSQCCFLCRLGQRGMGVHDHTDVFRRAAILEGEYHLGDQLRHVRTDEMRTKQLVRLRISNELHEARRVTGCTRAAIRGERKLPDFVLAPRG